MMNRSPRVCIDRVFGSSEPIQYSVSGETHKKFSRFQEDLGLSLAIVRQKMWKPGKSLRIRFLEGDPEIQNKVKEKAMDWTKYANIKFTFVPDDNEAEIQIAFQQGAGSWSAIGTDASTANPGEATMNFGWLDANTEDKEYSRVVKHEFGHALGLIHEHQNPAGGINWNKDAVYEALSGPPNNWDRQTIDHNMFDRYNKNITNYTATDPNSIMMYYIPADWTLDSKSYGENVFDIDDTDKKFIKEWYP
jgi:serralysin